jgi:MFS family permease
MPSPLIERAGQTRQNLSTSAVQLNCTFMASAGELLIAELRDKLDGQLKTLESARTRAGVAISASGVIAGLFAQHLKAPIGNWGLAAIAAFVVGTFPAVWILLPHRMTLSPKAAEWIDFAASHQKYVQAHLEHVEGDPNATGELGAAQLAVPMVKSMNGWYEKNGPLLNAVHLAVAIAFIGVVVQIICWAGSITHGLGHVWPWVGIAAVILMIVSITVVIEAVSRRRPKVKSAEVSATETQKDQNTAAGAVSTETSEAAGSSGSGGGGGGGAGGFLSSSSSSGISGAPAVVDRCANHCRRHPE